MTTGLKPSVFCSSTLLIKNVAHRPVFMTSVEGPMSEIWIETVALNLPYETYEDDELAASLYSIGLRL